MKTPKYRGARPLRSVAVETVDDTRFGGTHTGEDYTPEQVEFMLAMDAFKRRTGHMFPTWSEVLGVLLSLGYAKPNEPIPDVPTEKGD